MRGGYPAFFPDSERGTSMITRGEPSSFGNPARSYPQPTLRGKASVGTASAYGWTAQNGTPCPDNYPDTVAALWPLADAVRVWSGFVAPSLLLAPYAAGWLGGA